MRNKRNGTKNRPGLVGIFGNNNGNNNGHSINGHSQNVPLQLIINQEIPFSQIQPTPTPYNLTPVNSTLTSTVRELKDDDHPDHSPFLLANGFTQVHISDEKNPTDLRRALLSEPPHDIDKEDDSIIEVDTDDLERVTLTEDEEENLYAYILDIMFESTLPVTTFLEYLLILWGIIVAGGAVSTSFDFSSGFEHSAEDLCWIKAKNEADEESIIWGMALSNISAQFCLTIVSFVIVMINTSRHLHRVVDQKTKECLTPMSYTDKAFFGFIVPSALASTLMTYNTFVNAPHNWPAPVSEAIASLSFQSSLFVNLNFANNRIWEARGDRQLAVIDILKRAKVELLKLADEEDFLPFLEHLQENDLLLLLNQHVVNAQGDKISYKEHFIKLINTLADFLDSIDAQNFAIASAQTHVTQTAEVTTLQQWQQWLQEKIWNPVFTYSPMLICVGLSLVSGILNAVAGLKAGSLFGLPIVTLAPPSTNSTHGPCAHLNNLALTNLISNVTSANPTNSIALSDLLFITQTNEVTIADYFLVIAPIICAISCWYINAVINNNALTVLRGMAWDFGVSLRQNGISQLREYINREGVMLLLIGVFSFGYATGKGEQAKIYSPLSFDPFPDTMLSIAFFVYFALGIRSINGFTSTARNNYNRYLLDECLHLLKDKKSGKNLIDKYLELRAEHPWLDYFRDRTKDNAHSKALRLTLTNNIITNINALIRALNSVEERYINRMYTKLPWYIRADMEIEDDYPDSSRRQRKTSSPTLRYANNPTGYLPGYETRTLAVRTQHTSSPTPSPSLRSIQSPNLNSLSPITPLRRHSMLKISNSVDSLNRVTGPSGNVSFSQSPSIQLYPPHSLTRNPPANIEHSPPPRQQR